MKFVMAIVILSLLQIGAALVWSSARSYSIRTNMQFLIRDSKTSTVRTPTEGFVITLNKDRGHKVAEKLKVAFGIEDMHVVMGHVGNYSTLSPYNRFLMRHGRTDGLQIGTLGMLGCMESHREVWTRVRQDSYVFEDDAVPAANALKIAQMLLIDNADRPWSVIHLDRPSGFVSGRLFAPDKTQFTNVGKITETCRDCVTYSARGYIITKTSAEILLQSYEPLVVQVDAYMSLLNAYHPHFKHVWTRVDAVHEHHHPSSTQDYNEALQFEWGISNFLTPQH
jgi:hypothetical protein